MLNSCTIKIKMKTVLLFALALGLSAAEVILTKPGQAVTFTCNVNSYNTLVWSHGGITIVTIDGKTGQSRKGMSNFEKRFTTGDKTLRISPVKKEDAGTFSCTADGKREDHTLLVVSVSQSPPGDLELGSEATLQCQVTGLSSGSVPHWKRPDGSETNLQTAQLKPVTDSYEGTWECLFTHGGVSYSESLVVKMKKSPKTPAPLPSQKSEGGDHPTCIGCVSGSPPTQILPLPDMKWWIWVAIGVCSLVVIILVVVLIILCRRITGAKRKRQRRQNGHHPLEPRQYCQCNRPTAAAKAQQGRRREKPMALPRQPLLME